MNNAVVGNLAVLLSLDSSNFDKGATSAASNVKKLADRLNKDLIPSQQRINSLVRDFAGNREITRALEYATAIQQIGGATKLTAEHQAKANRAAQEAINVYRALGQTVPKEINELAVSTAKLSKETTGLATATAKVKPTLAGMGDDVTALAGKARALAGVFGVTLGAGAIVSFAKSTFDAADKVVDLSSKMGVSIEAAQRFQFAARQSGADIEDVTQSIVKMNNNLAVGDKSTVAALAQAGLKFEDVRAMKPEDAFRAIADAIGKIPDPMIQSNVALELFGKSGATLLPMIRENALKAADGARIMKEETVVALEAAQQSWENFWSNITAIAGDAIADMLPQIKQMLSDVKTGFAFLARFQTSMARGNSLGVSAMAAFGLGVADNLADQKTQRAAELARLAGFEGVGDAQELGANLGLFGQAMPFKKDLRTKEQRDADAKAERDSREQERRSVEAHVKRVKDLIESVPDNGLVSFVPFAFANPALANGINGMFPNAAIPMGEAKPDFVKFLALEFGDPRFANGINAAFATPSSKGGGLGATFQGLLSDMPETILRSFRGGGNVGKSLGGLFGGGMLGNFGDMVGKKLAGSFLGKGLGSAIGSVIPGVGTLLGGLLGGSLGKIFGPGQGARVNDMRDEFFAAQGGVDAIRKTLQQFNNDPQLTAAFNKMFFTGKEGNFKAGMDAYQKRLTELQQRQMQILDRTSALGTALGALGGVAPRALDSLINGLLGSNIPPELRTLLEGSRKPNWQTAFSAAQTLGIDEGALGSGLRQMKVAEQAFDLFHQFEMFERFGSDMNGVLQGMADEFSTLAVEAMRGNVALPKQLESVFKRLAASGMLVDQDGNAIAMEQLRFEELEDEKLNEAVRLLSEIRDLLAGRTPGSGAPAPGAPGSGGGGEKPDYGHDEPPTNGGYDQPPDFGLPGFAGGTHGRFMDFGPGTPVMLHGKERIVTAGEGMGGGSTIYINAIDAPSFEKFLKQRGGAEAIVRTMTGPIDRWGRAQ